MFKYDTLQFINATFWHSVCTCFRSSLHDISQCLLSMILTSSESDNVMMIYIIVHFGYHLIPFTTGWYIPLSYKIPQSILTRSFFGIINISLVKTIGIDIQQPSAGYDDKSPLSMLLMNRNYSYISTLYPYEWIKSLVIGTCFEWIYLSFKFIIKHIHRHQTRHQSLKMLKLSSLSLSVDCTMLWK